jgi:hypothetical protein
MNTQFAVLSLFAALSVGTTCNAQLFAATAKTVSSNTGDPLTSQTATRLFTSGSTPAPLGTTLWFVADVNRDGIDTTPTLGDLPAAPVVGSRFGGDNVLLHVDQVDGSLSFPNPGRFQRVGINVTDDAAAPGGSLKNANIWVVLWNGSGLDFTPAVGDTFGALDIGVKLPPTNGSGNAFWAIESNIVANSFTVVPEPEEYAAMIGAGLVGFAFLRRRQTGK